MVKAADKLLVFCFIIFLSGMLIFNILTPDRGFSQRENRYLAAPPEFSWKSISSGKFSQEFEEYITDEFALRDQWVLFKSDMERLLLKTENNGIFFGRDGYLLEDFQRPGAALDRNIGNINRFIDTFPDIAVHMALAPNSVAIYPEKLPPFAKVHDQQLVTEQVQAELQNDILIPLYKTLLNHKDDYIYYRTDHHWTTLGAYYAYVEMADVLGFTPLDISEFDTKTAADEFWGTYFSRANNRYLNSDTLPVMLPQEPVQVQVEFNDRDGIYDSLYFPGHLETRDKYNLFLDGNHPLTTITTDVGNGRKLAVFKDSYAHCLLPFLAQHYEEIHVIDLRFYKASLGPYLEEHNIQQALFLYSISSFSNNNSITGFRP